MGLILLVYSVSISNFEPRLDKNYNHNPLYLKPKDITIYKNNTYFFLFFTFVYKFLTIFKLDTIFFFEIFLFKN